MNIGIIGNAADKFTTETMAKAIDLIEFLILGDIYNGSPLYERTIVSGRCPLGGVDVWAETRAVALGFPTKIFPPKNQKWEKGYKPRNLQIAKNSDELHVIVVRDYPPDYRGRRFDVCYHCHEKRPPHVKSGACWTAIQFERAKGKLARWHILG